MSTLEVVHALYSNCFDYFLVVLQHRFPHRGSKLLKEGGGFDGGLVGEASIVGTILHFVTQE